jgi:ParB family chromosome partitioning protein
VRQASGVAARETGSPAPAAPGTARHAGAERVKQLLADGQTVERVAAECRWPRARVTAVIKDWAGWLFDYRTDKAVQLGPGRSEPEPPPASRAGQQPPAGLTLVLVHALEPHPHNRTDLGDLDELADSIRAQGLLQPLVVTPHTSPGRYVILIGHRRHAAAQIAKLAEVPVIIRPELRNPGEAVEHMLSENGHRKDLNPIEKATAFDRLRRRGYSNALIARRTGFSEGTITRHLTLTELDPDAQELVRSGQLPVGDAVGIVRSTRQQPKKAGGRRRVAEPEYLTITHPLGPAAKQLCRSQGHRRQGLVGKVACGHCWEDVIRADERARPGRS